MWSLTLGKNKKQDNIKCGQIANTIKKFTSCINTDKDYTLFPQIIIFQCGKSFQKHLPNMFTLLNFWQVLFNLSSILKKIQEICLLF